MLYLTRKPGESIIINDNIVLKLISVKGQTAKLGFEFPEDATVLREEIYKKIKNEGSAPKSNSTDTAETTDKAEDQK